MILDMLEYYNMKKKHNINVIYSGPIWAEGIEGIGAAIRNMAIFDELSLSVSQSIFSVFVEQMNNMLMYSSEKEAFDLGNKRANTPKGVFVLGTQDKSYFLQSGNVISGDNVEKVKVRLDFLNTLDKKQLREYYKEQIKAENPNSESKGAGLGLIEIARRATSPIEYSFVPFDDGLSFFTMFVTIGGDK